jgi:hypothetical protein
MEVKFVELKQRHVEAFTAETPDPEKTKAIQYFGDVVRAAVKAGWLESPKIDNVDEMAPKEVKNLALAVLAEFARVMGISPS